MNRLSRISQITFAFIVVISLSLQGIPPAAAQAGGEVRTGRNAHTGKLSFIGAEPGRPMAVAEAQVPGLSQRDRALAMIRPYAADLGLKEASRELAVESTRAQPGRQITRFQQTYQGIPVMAGELIVNADDKGGLLSINGEIAPDLDLDVNPTITAEQAAQTAIAAVAKSQGGGPGDYIATEPALWIYDSRLLEPDGTTAGLVWRMDVRARDGSRPINELVLVDAHRGNIRLSFNQIDTSWSVGAGTKPSQEIVPSPTPIVTEPPVDPVYTPTPMAPPASDSDSGPAAAQPEAASTWYVSNSGSDANACTSYTLPCLTIQRAVNLAAAGDTIKVASGTYTYAGSGNASPNVVITGKSLTLLGGWNEAFSAQTGSSIIDGEYGIAGTGHNNNGLLINNGSAVVMVDRFVIQNSVSSNGGGIYVAGGTLTLQNSTVRDNHAGNTGAGILLIFGASLTLTNTTISGNAAGVGGSGIYINTGAGTITIQYSTIAHNLGQGGIGQVGSTLIMRDSILADNLTYDCLGTISSSDHNIIGDSTGCTVAAGAGDQFDVDPLLDASLSGDPPAHGLIAGSPAIDAGDNAICPATDAHGMTRALDGTCDVGAVEYVVPGPAASVTVLSGSGQRADLSTEFTDPLRARVADENGVAVVGETVTFTAPESGVSGVFADSLTNATEVTTDSTGVATSPAFTANGMAGRYMVEASVAGVTTPAQFQLTNGPLTATIVSVSSGSPQVALTSTAFGAPLRALVEDQYGDPLAGITVTFTAPAEGASGTFAVGNSNTTTAVTNASGIATASTFTASESEGSYVVEASVEGIAVPAQFSLSNILLATATIEVKGGSPQAAGINTAFTSPLQALVKDGSGNPLPGIGVTFTAPASGASGTFAGGAGNSASTATGADGVATSPVFSANGTIGGYVVEAAVNGLTVTAQFELINADGHTWYVSTDGADTSDCQSPVTACATINAAIGKAASDDTIRIAAGTYTRTEGLTPLVSISMSLNLLGGYDTSFANQVGATVLDGKKYLTDISITGTPTVNIDHFWVKYGEPGVSISGGTVTFSTSSISENGGYDRMGGIYATAGSLTLNNSTVSQNQGTTRPAGIRSTGTSLTLNNTTVVYNVGYSGATGGLSVADATNVSLHNSIIALNSTNCSGRIDAAEHSVFGSYCDVPSSTNLENIDPKITTYAMGALPYYALVSDSPAVDSGNPATCLSTDQRGVARPQGSACDRGAYEYAVPGAAVAIGIASGSGQRAAIDNNFVNPLAAFVLDSQGSPVPGAEVTFTAPGSGPGGTFAGSGTNVGTAITAGNGVATAPTLTANALDGSYQVEASIGGGASPVQFQLQNVRPTTITMYSGSPQTIRINLAFGNRFKVQVKDQIGQGIAGVDVTFTAPASGASGVFADSGTNVSHALTDAQGYALAPVFTANGLTGDYTLNATAAGDPPPAQFLLTNVYPAILTYTMFNGTSPLPGHFLCGLAEIGCTNGTDPNADAAEKYAYGTYEFLRLRFGRDSINGSGMGITSSVRFGRLLNNAFWSGEQMVYADDEHPWPQADDVVAHELMHGVTQYESDLYYYYQSGAINESISDIFGELYDQANGQGTDTTANRWLLGEDVSGVGPFRSMSNPPQYLDPDSITHGYYDKGDDDSGGVHTNSGVGNKAAYLLVDGGTFNAKTVTPLGADKTLAIYYEADTHLLLSGSDYADLYYILPQACLNLVGGTTGITAADCLEVQDAVDAVKMNQQPAANYNTDAPLCDVGKHPSTFFYDDLESGTNNWTMDLSGRWELDSHYGSYAHSGAHFLYADDLPDMIADVSATMKNGIAIPAGAYLHFAHAYDFEQSPDGVLQYDGGVLEYSTDNGATWQDAGSKMDFNGYRDKIETPFGNPLGGRMAFVASSHGYISTRLNLSSLAGQTVKFRWRMGLDVAGFSMGWWLDDVRIYTCPTNTYQISGKTGVSGVKLAYFDGTDHWAYSTIDYGYYGIYIPYNWSGTVTPSRAGFIFTPDHRHLANVITDTPGQDFAYHRATADFNASGNTDIGVYRPSTRGWFIKNQTSTIFGLDGDIPIPADYDGNGTADMAVFRPSNAGWFVRGVLSTFYGAAGDIPVPGDYNRDGTIDIAVYRPSTSAWYIRNQSATIFGLPGDIPVPADYNGDGKTDIAVYRPSTRAWYVKDQLSTVFGLAGDIPVPGDYDGNGTADVAVFRPSSSGWFVRNISSTIYGAAGDIPVPGDYNADGITDIAVYRPSTSGWFVKGQSATVYGTLGDYPLPAPDTNADGDPYQ